MTPRTLRYRTTLTILLVCSQIALNLTVFTPPR
jgi:hypothetical protein